MDDHRNHPGYALLESHDVRELKDSVDALTRVLVRMEGRETKEHFQVLDVLKFVSAYSSEIPALRRDVNQLLAAADTSALVAEVRGMREDLGRLVDALIVKTGNGATVHEHEGESP